MKVSLNAWFNNLINHRISSRLYRLTPPVAGIILSAGKSSRIGSPKALLTYQGDSFLQRLITVYQAAQLSPLMVVLGPWHSSIITETCDLSRCLVVTNPDQESSMMTSIQLAISSLPSDSQAAVVQPVDLPLIQAAIIESLVEAWARTKAPIVRPRYRGRFGHPILLDHAVFPLIRQAAEGESLRTILDSLSPQVAVVDVEAPEVRIEVDTPNDYTRLHQNPDQN